MKVETAPSFFKSLKSVLSPKAAIRERLYHIRYRRSKGYKKVLKTLKNGYPWDYAYLYFLEKAKIEEIRDYIAKHKRFVGWENAVRDMNICINLIDIFMEKKELYKYNGLDTMKFVKIEGSDNYEMKFDTEPEYVCLVNVNTKNAKRFVKNKAEEEYMLKNPHLLYIEKARALYHKIRLEKDQHWWD